MCGVWIKLTNQKGTALVIALLVMVMATVVAICANFTSTTELAISGNQRRYSTDFFRADGGLELIKSYFLDNFAFPANVGGTTTVETLPPADQPLFQGLDPTQTHLTKVFEGPPPRGSGVSAQYFRGNYYRSRSEVPSSVSLEEEFCLISPK